MNAERIGMQGMMACIGRGNHQFGGHTADTCAGGAEVVIFNEIDIVGMLAGVAKSAHAGGSAADYGNISFDFFHVFPFGTIRLCDACLKSIFGNR